MTNTPQRGATEGNKADDPSMVDQGRKRCLIYSPKRDINQPPDGHAISAKR
jgi:hypothetical protein